jgi:putative phosphoribosyl transferase
MKRVIGEETGESVIIPAGDVQLEGNLVVPDEPRGIVLFAHGSGSSRFSVRNRFVAGVLNEGGLATLLMDLLSIDEEAVDLRTTQLRFDIAFLAQRLLYAMDWLADNAATEHLKIGAFGSSTGGAAALVAAAERQDSVAAVVSRGGRPDMAGTSLPVVRCPTLLIVGGNDSQVIELNQQAYRHLVCEKKLEIIPRATHLFEEPGALEAVADLARDWFVQHLG